ncbi:MAG: tRNA lysidine(34) synthetase TilS [Pseudomonadota bacterium]|nr:tRNA lysidine(34) synthetase TilS [Pseudomonadota bacterium]
MVNDNKFPLTDLRVCGLFSSYVNHDRIALAVSGGRDSMALMCLVYRWKAHLALNIEIEVITVNHNLRKAAEDECRFVQKIAKDYGFRHKVLIWEHEYIETSIQEKARNARYQLMLDYAREENIDTILTAHTSDDNIETFIMRLAKGSGLDGLKSINEIRHADGIQIERPLLSLSRSLTTEILRSTGNEWVDDPTNEDERFERVKIRNNISSLSSFNISSGNLTKTIQRLTRAHESISFFTNLVSQELVELSELGHADVNFDKLRNYPKEIILRVLAKALTDINGGTVSLSSLEAVFTELTKTERCKTLNGCQIIPQKNKYVIVRENRGISPAEIKINERISWDGRFDVHLKSCDKTNIVIDQIGNADDLRTMIDGTSFQSMPKYVLRTLPGGFIKDKLVLLPNTHNIYNSGYLDVKFRISDEKKFS